MLQIKRSQIYRYGVAVLAVTLTLVVKLLLSSFIGSQTPFLLFFAAVVVSAWYGGLGPGLLSTALSTLATQFFFLPPPVSLTLSSNAFVQMVAFGLEGTLISVLCTELYVARRRAEINLFKLQTSESRLRRLVDSNVIGIIFGDFRGNVIEANDIWLDSLGYTREDVQSGKVNFIEITPPEYRHLDQQAMEEMKRTGRHTPFEKEYIRKDGTRVPVLVGTAYLGGSDELGVGFLIDLSDRKRIEANLRQLTEQVQAQANTLEAILAASVDHIYVVEREGRYKHVSNGGAAVLGLQPKEVIGKTWQELGLPPEVMQPFDRQREEAIATGVPQKLETDFLVSENDLHHYEYIIAPLHQNQQIEGVVVISRDTTESKRLEEELRRQEQQFKTLAENAPDIISRVDAKFRHLYLSPAIERVTGIPAEAFIGKTSAQIGLPKEIYIPLQECWQRVLTNGQECEYEFNFPAQDGTRWYQARLVPEFATDGTVESVMGITRDVTEYKRVEEALRQSEERLRLALTAAHMIVWDVDLSTEQVICSENASEIWGFYQGSREEFAAIFHADDREKITQASARALAGEAPFLLDYRILQPSGEIRWFNSQGSVYRHTDGEAQRIIGVSIDITDRKQTEQALRESEEAQRFLAEVSKVLASSLDYQTTLTSIAQLVVPHVADWCVVHIIAEAGVSRQLAVSHVNPNKIAWAKELQRRYPYDPNAPTGVAHVIRTGESGIYPEITDAMLVEAARDAEHLQLLREVGFSSVMMVPMKVHERSLGAITFIAAESGRCYKQTDLILAEELGRRAALAVENAQLYDTAQRDRAKAEAANRVKDEFLAVLSHELRSPLNPILGWSKLLQSGKLDKTKTAHALETIERNAKLQAQLIEDLLDVSRILQGKLVLNVDPVELKTTMESALETVRLAAEAKSIRIHTLFAPNVGKVSGDANRLQQVIWNLLTNAVKFTPPGGQVDIQLEQVDTYAQIQVKDTGKGISPDFLPYVFEYFRQEDGTTTRQFGGLGLGLAIVRHLTELHGGTVQADSPGEGLGATFTVKLPLLKDKGGRIKDEFDPDSSSLIPHPLEGVRVLVVDDEGDMRELVAVILSEYGASVEVAASAKEALIALERCTPDVLVSDVGMPDVDGYMLMRHIRNLPPEQGGVVPAIALTAYAGALNQQQALAAGFQMHLSKPVEPEQLVTAIVGLGVNIGFVSTGRMRDEG